MNKKYIMAILSMAFLLAGLNSCDKEETKATDSEKPVINIQEPMLNDTISLASEDSIHIMLSVSDNDELHEVAVNITNDAGTNVFSKKSDVDAKTFTFHDHFHPHGITNVTLFTLKVEASDHNSNEEEKSIKFFVKP
ncbi:MAG: DUF4625 domain-containing protein [Flavobacteriales bacterium]|nr:DUF4625 domain-containing protein [Flavobacteriales bacterium]